MFGKANDDPNTFELLKRFAIVHWRGIVCFLAPFILASAFAPKPELHHYVFYTYLLMATFWLTQCIPLEITSFIPVIIFPLTGVMTSEQVCQCYVDDSILLLLAILFMAFALKQSGLLHRLAMAVINVCSCSLQSHTLVYLLLGFITSSISAFIPNTVTVAVMIPVMFTVLQAYENQGVLKIYDTDSKGEKIASDITTCYFCSITLYASIGGVTTLTGTATNLAFKSLYHANYPFNVDHFQYLTYVMFGCQFPILLSIASFFYQIIMYFGVFGIRKEAAKKAKIPSAKLVAIKKAIKDETKKLGTLATLDLLILLFMILAVLLFATRNTITFHGWDRLIENKFGLPEAQNKSLNEFGLQFRNIEDSSPAMLICVTMFLLPGSLLIIKNFTAKVQSELPKTPIPSLLKWKELNAAIPFGFIFLIGAGRALVMAMTYSKLDKIVEEKFKAFKDLPPVANIFIIVLIVLILTNIASNIVIVNLTVPMVMRLAVATKQLPHWFCVAAGCTASFAFLLPIGCPGNSMIAQAAKIPIKKMAIAGSVPTIAALIFTWIDLSFIYPMIEAV